jgi:serine/threonine protein kinase
LDTNQWRDLQDCASRLERTLVPDADPGDLRRFLTVPPGAPHRRAVLLELIKTSLEHLYRHRRGRPLEDIVRQYPELGGSGDLPADLLLEEYRLRWKYGDRPPLDDYLTRFPLQFDRFRQLAERDAQGRPADEPSFSTCETIAPPASHATAPPGRAAGEPPPPAAPPATTHGGSSLVLSRGEPYQLLERIGRGEFGEVYRALAPGGVEVALKRIFRSVNDETCQRELRALKRVSEIRHPFLLQTQSFQAFGDHLVIVMELADGSLKDRLEECLPGGVPADELLRYFTEAAEALDFLRRERLSHRDIKPANLLHLKGHAKVADFGIARQQEAAVDHTINFAGTPAYMPPELWRKEISVHSDQYSFAASWYELRTGKRAFPGQSMPEVALLHLNGQPDLSGVPEAEQRVLLRALAKDPEQRFPSCTEFVLALKKTLEPPAPLPPKPPRGFGKTLAFSAAGVLLGALVALVASLLIRPRQPAVDWPPPPEWIPAGDPVEVNGQHYFRQLKRVIGSETVYMVLVPQTIPSEPRTFYIMRDKFWNDLYRVYLEDPKSEELLRKNSSGLGCPALVQGPDEWAKGASRSGSKAGEPLGVAGPRGKMPVFRVTATQAECAAEWLGGHLPTLEQWRKAAALNDPAASGGVLNGDPEGLAVNLNDGPKPIDFGRDVINDCRQLVTNGREYTRTLADDDKDELPLKSYSADRHVRAVGQSYAGAKPPTVESLERRFSVPCPEACVDVSFRAVLER